MGAPGGVVEVGLGGKWRNEYRQQDSAKLRWG